ncbi:receptor-like cytosolic serine/threonine-protein kinase RBK1 [Momordica charantia]|uniref:Receptor-like cytosolic serine/threonine-protein kinase RBK1 n=1 Tax=Momordica charantia TaxID=3673 RepID=A0A6J1CFZ7_MOMCH|nr:receptor-like cytosolic serine/threonine-protein kinase RBK1 [Momordica charantia]
MLSRIRSKTRKKRTIIFGLKSDNGSRDILLWLLTTIINPGDNVLAVHVREPNDSFNPNSFHIHEDICKSKQVDLQVKVSEADSYISNLTRQVRENYATILVLGCSLSRPDYSVFSSCLKGLPPTCTLMVMDNLGRILLQKQGTSQQGSEKALLQSSQSSVSKYAAGYQQANSCHLQKSLTLPSSLPSSSRQASEKQEISLANKKARPFPGFASSEPFPRLALQDSRGTSREFTSEQLNRATNNFNPVMVIGEGGHSKVYRANLEDGQAAAVKVLSSHSSSHDLVQEVEIFSEIKHENIVQIIGFCNDRNMKAIVYSLLKGSLKQYLRKRKWRERVGIAIGVAKALTYLHHSCNPPIIHRDVKSSNILLFDNFQPQLADFGEATVLRQSQNAESNINPYNVVGTFGYLAPEYIMYGKVDEKIDVYSYGVVLLELITGKEAIQTDQNSHGSLVLRARSLLGFGLGDRLIDPNLKGNYNKVEMRAMMMAARLCLLYSSSRRPIMETILKLLEEPEYLFKMQEARDELFNGGSTEEETYLWRYDEPDGEESTLTEAL